VTAVPDGSWAALSDELAADVRRVADRLRSLSQSRLAAPAPPHASRADACRDAAQALADAAQGVAERASATEPRWRTLPRLSDLAVGDEVAVTGQDLLDELALCDPDTPVWTRSGRRPARQVVAGAAGSLAAARRLL
jgi:hypothetical protein